MDNIVKKKKLIISVYFCVTIGKLPKLSEFPFPYL